MEGNYIKIDRKMLSWEWYKNLNTKSLFIHMLIIANWKEGRFEGKHIPRGSFVSSIGNLAEETGLTVDEVRTAISHLIKTGEITKQSTNKFTVFTIKNYDVYQDIPNQSPSNSQAIPKLFPTIEERKEGKKEINNTFCMEQNSEPPIILLPLNDGTDHPVIQREVDEWSKLYPAVDVMQELRNMKGWLDSNGRRRKTKSGIKRFINSWLAREQDKPRTGQKTHDPAKQFNQFMQNDYDFEQLEKEILAN